MATFTFRDFLNYKVRLDESIRKEENVFFYNESFIHAAMVMKTLIEKSKRENTPINMYCGKFSLFRDGAKRKIEKIKEDIKETVVEDERQEFDTFDPYGDLLKSFYEFMDDGGKLNLIVAKSLDGIQDELIWPKLKEYIDCNKCIVKKLNISIDLDHFVVSGNSFRKENSDEEKTAICSFYNQEVAVVLSNTFEILKNFSSKYQFAN